MNATWIKWVRWCTNYIMNATWMKWVRWCTALRMQHVWNVFSGVQYHECNMSETGKVGYRWVVQEGLTPLTFTWHCLRWLFLLIIVHSFYIALFSTLKQTHCAHWPVILNEWLYPFIARIINIHGSGVLVALCGCCMAGATWNAAVLAQILCTPFNHAPDYSLTSFKAT